LVANTATIGRARRQRTVPRRLRLRELRERRLLSQEMLSEKSGVGTTTIHRIESGATFPRYVTIRKLAAALGVEPEELVEWEGDAPAKDPKTGKAAA